ncbi:MAG: tetratricopeptide repeat protein [Bacteroidota bacterium]
MKVKYTLYILISLMVVGCSTSKNTWLSRGYHNLTAKYNVFFNGEQSFEKGRESMRGSIRDDYTHVLPMFVFSEGVDAEVPSSQMERAIQKGHKLIKEHSITAKPEREPAGGDTEYREFFNQKEFNRWVDDSWMLIGKAHMHLHEWREAARAFDQVIRIFPGKSVRFEAMLWMARAYIEMEDFESAGQYLDRFSSGVEDEKNYAALASSTYAWYWLSRDNFAEALDYCREAADQAGDRWQKVRWYYVLGQVAERTDNLSLAHEAYQKVVRMNPDYEFQIHARIKNALLEGGPENPEISRRELEKLPDEYKNRPYRDQIYYALAQTWFWEEDTLNALTNLQLAAGYGEENQTLSGEVYRKMAEVYFNSGEYIAAGAYYDSTLTVLPDDHENIEEIRRKKKKLTPLAQSLQTIQYEDSVQRIAALPEAEREQFIDDLLVQLEQEEEETRMGGDMGSDASFYRNFSGNQRRNSGESDQWYFYNQAMVSLGKMEFEKRWGRRELEDNWRRSGKSAESDDSDRSRDDGNMMPSDPFEQDPTGEGSPKPGGEGSQESGVPDRETLVEELPLSEEKMLESHQRKQQALFNAANALAHNFEKYREAVATFEQLLSEYPQNRYREQTLMGIYMACREINDQECVDHYGQVILDDYPDSRFARFVADPRFFEDQEMFRQEMEELYRSAYHDFKSASWNDAIDKTEEIMNGTSQQLIPQAALLNALSYSQLGESGLFKQRLEDIVENFPNSSQADVADHWLALVEEGREPADIQMSEASMVSDDETSDGNVTETEGETEGEEEAESQFSMEPDSAHYVMTVLDKESDTDQFMFHMANFNFDHFTRDWLQLEAGGLGNEFNVVETGPFDDSQSGLNYLYSLLDNPSVFRVDDAGEPVVLLISENNRDNLEASNDLDAYIEFFLENYLPGNNSSAIVISESEIPENNYLETREPEKVSMFSPNQGEVWGMIIVSGDDGDMDEARSFLPGMTRSVLRERISISAETLPEGEDVLLLKEFEKPADFDELSSALDENSFWQSRVVGEDWVICPVSPENFQLLKDEEGSLEEYLDFVGK